MPRLHVCYGCWICNGRAADPVIDLFLEDQKNNTVLVCLVKREGYKVVVRSTSDE